MKKLILAVALGISIGCAHQNSKDESQVDFRNSSLDMEARLDDLVSRMTTSEKISQLFNDAPAIERLGIPAYNWWNEALHGVARAGKATVFPQAIGLAATFDEDLMFRVATAISDEGRAKYHHYIDNDVHTIYGGLTFWSPNINIFRDPRWGRGQETYGEDPYLTGRMAVNFVRGIQGDDEKYLKAVATIKHYAVHSGPEKSRHSDDYHPSKKDLHETYLPAFRTAIKEASPESLMCAYNRVDGKPACGNEELLQKILREDMGFKGFVVSDCGAISDFYDRKAHDVVLAPAEAAAWALKTGTDLECGDSHLNTYVNLHTALREGLVSMEDIDLAVKRVFRARFKLGMFDEQNRVPYSSIPLAKVASAEHIALTQEAAEKSLVLLKNDGILPLKEGVKVAVIGPNATNFEVLIGNYSGYPSQPVLPIQGIIDRIGAENVVYAPGSAIAETAYRHHQVIPAVNFYHYDDNSMLVPGLQADYYVGNYGPKEWLEKIPSAKPDLTRVDSNIDFYWDKSPVNQKLDEQFLVIWRGVIKPEKTGNYSFSGNVLLTINGERVTKPVELKRGQTYNVEARYFAFKWWPINLGLEANARLTWADVSLPLEADAIAAAKKADVVLFMGGIDPTLEGEEMAVQLDGFEGGDRTHINLPEVQTKLLKKLKSLGKPIVFVNFSGSAMAMNWESENLNAIVQAFYPGEKAGTAIARVLWGDVNPSGRLPITFYRGVEDLPAFTDYTMKNRTYKFYSGKPLYPFGHGLSYTSFRYENLVVKENNAGLDISVKVTNVGERAGEDVPQLYISLLDAPAGSPIRQLKSFTRVQLTAGESTQVIFNLPSQHISFINDQGEEVSYSGRVKISVGSGQEGYVAKESIDQKTIKHGKIAGALGR